ncbi:Do family serine endopeptidase [Sneathiella chungangensis]|uniref:Do family serine endopeptidase n=1 Tax=Sneathiella chungangensis TaxID=1418234 RepID=A0A845MF13_9PROT|nr:Do family serine endopeptidase [Sneathiella chungangensis]MZR21644.1 Do family serine endopeptidase [Sneathiella chungangensis]
MNRIFRTVTSALALGFLFIAAAPAIAEDVVPQSQQQIMLSFAPLVKKAVPAVVNIFTKTRVTQTRPSLFDDPFFKRFFGGNFGPPRQRQKIQNSLGSGVLVDGDGIIVTNYHVVGGADEITVALSDRREFDAHVIVSDERTDLAILKIEVEGESLPYLEFADSDKLEIGDLVIAIGNPFGVGQTVTSGIISALDRSAGLDNEIQSFIQTDAAINPGNSGGALLTMDGRLAGINSAIFSKSGGSLGIGFAIPANLVKAVLTNGLATGRVVRPWLGAVGQEITGDVADGLGLEKPGGVLVNRVHPYSAAYQAGLRVGDVIVSIDDKEILGPETLTFRVASGVIGKTARLGVYREGRLMDLELNLQPAPELPPRDLETLTGRHPLSGAVLGNLSPAYALELGISAFAEGVVVAGTLKGSVAERYGLRPRDILLVVNGEKIVAVEQAKSVLEKAGGSWQISIRRNGRTLSFKVSS